MRLSRGEKASLKASVFESVLSRVSDISLIERAMIQRYLKFEVSILIL
jgi:hypothetical protein